MAEGPAIPSGGAPNCERSWSRSAAAGFRPVGRWAPQTLHGGFLLAPSTMSSDCLGPWEIGADRSQGDLAQRRLAALACGSSRQAGERPTVSTPQVSVVTRASAPGPVLASGKSACGDSLQVGKPWSPAARVGFLLPGSRLRWCGADPRRAPRSLRRGAGQSRWRQQGQAQPPLAATCSQRHQGRWFTPAH